MYCDKEKLSCIFKKLKGTRLQGIYPDWGNGILYFRFEGLTETVMLRIKNNYYTGIDIVDCVEEPKEREENEVD